jgi:ascorbate PTS system EIIB component
MKIRKILCCCIAGMGSSFIVEMNLKKVLNKLNMNDVEVDHAGIYDAFSGSADLFICSSDVYEECLKAGDSIPLDRLTDLNELETKLTAYLESHK